MRHILLLLASSLLALNCSGIKVSKSMLKMLLSGTNKVSTELTYADSCEHTVGIPYIQDGDPSQVLDVYHADKAVRKDAVLVDVHGGFYVAGKRQNNRKFASVFLKAGYDVVLVEYRLNDGKRDVEDELKDCAAAFDYIADHAAELGLNAERCFLTGDSAGGHLALYMAEGCGDRSLPVHPERFSAKGVMLNCPAYDFASYGNPDGMFTKSALSWFLGPRYTDEAWMASMSPRTHLSSLEAPLLVSTCTNDFLRGESLKLNSDCEQAGRQIEFVDIASDDKKVAHVHNVVNLSLPESLEVNERMIRFMDGLILAGLK